jgi:hypothetical protein
MDFTVNGTRTTITITKATGCPSSEDGDASVWYDYAAEALDNGAQHKLKGGTTTVISDTTEIRTSWDSDLDVDF